MNSLEVLNALHHLSVRHAGVYFADRLPRVWMRSTAIIARMNMIDLVNTGFLHRQEHILIAACRSWTEDSSYDFAETPPCINWNTMTFQGMLSQTYGQYCCVFYV